MSKSCALIIRGCSHCANMKNTRGSILTYSLENYKENFSTHLYLPLLKAFDNVDIYISTNTKLTDDEYAFFNPVHVFSHELNESSQLQKLHDICESIEKSYDYFVVHRFDVLYKYPLSFTELKHNIVVPYRHNRLVNRQKWGKRHPQLCDVYFGVPGNCFGVFIKLLKEQISRKPLYHLMLHSLLELFIRHSIQIDFLHDDMYDMTDKNPFFTFVGRS